MSCPCLCPSTGPARRGRQSDEEELKAGQKSTRLSRVSTLIKSRVSASSVVLGIVPRVHLLPLSALMGDKKDSTRGG